LKSRLAYLYILNLSMKTYSGQFYPSFFAPPIEATAMLSDQLLSIGYLYPQKGPFRLDWKVDAIEGSYLPADQCSRFVDPISKAELRISGREAFEYWEELFNESQKSWFARKKTGNLKRTLGIIGSLLLTAVLVYFLVIPWLAEEMADVVSRKTERQLGDSAYESMALTQAEDTMASRLVNEFFAALKVETKYAIRISVVEDETVNAFALPGGRIVVYTGLLESMGSYPELAALLSHEFVHVEQRHATRSMFRQLGTSAFVGVLFGNTGTIAGAIAGQANQLRTLSYSRSLEKEADLKGVEIIKSRRLDINGFDSLFKHLEEATPKGADLPEMISSHPEIQNRIAYIREAAKGATKVEHPLLNSIFEKLKQQLL
jgi:Zn-dependent protease with chaperone function